MAWHQNQKKMATTDVKQKVQLVKGEFTPSEASDIIEALIKQKVNFHKIQRLKLWTGDCECNTPGLDGRIGELIEDKKTAKAFINEARRKGMNIEINGSLEISYTEPSGEIKTYQISKN